MYRLGNFFIFNLKFSIFGKISWWKYFEVSVPSPVAERRCSLLFQTPHEIRPIAFNWRFFKKDILNMKRRTCLEKTAHALSIKAESILLLLQGYNFLLPVFTLLSQDTETLFTIFERRDYPIFTLLPIVSKEQVKCGCFYQIRHWGFLREVLQHFWKFLCLSESFAVFQKRWFDSQFFPIIHQQWLKLWDTAGGRKTIQHTWSQTIYQHQQS